MLIHKVAYRVKIIMKSKIVGEEDCNLTAILPCHYTDRTFKTVMVGNVVLV